MLTVRLFGRLQVARDRRALHEIPGGKTQELLCYLLVHRRQAHSREALATMLWPDCDPARSKKYLRQTLWQLQIALTACIRRGETHPLRIEADLVSIDRNAALEVDVDLFERSYCNSGRRAGDTLEDTDARAIDQAVQLYRGDLLQGSYQDWCSQERQRLQHSYLVMLSQLVGYCRHPREYERGIEYVERILQVDRAHERSHQQLMTLHFENGDRTAALRQYDRCRAALHEELGVEPSRETREMYRRMRSDPSITAVGSPSLVATNEVDVLGQLQQLLKFVSSVELQIRREIQLVQQSADDSCDRRSSSLEHSLP